MSAIKRTNQHVNLADMFEQGGIYQVKGSSVKEVIANAINTVELSREIEKDKIIQP